MRITVFGSGYVGLVQAAVLSEAGHQVVCMDVDTTRLAKIQEGALPFFEPGLNEL
ncbi:MAG: 3-hydroxyacyl-CoA dehydrogenase NAD-binding domain-containing protein, partial [Halieaceae bacterium]